MRKLLVFATLISLFGAVHAASCIITGDVVRSCSSSGSAASNDDIRAGSGLDYLCVATESDPIECREWSFSFSNILTVLDCVTHPGGAIFIR